MSVIPLQTARVSNLMRTNTATSRLNSVQAQLLDIQNQISTQKRVNATSDDPQAAGTIQQLQKLLERRDGYSTNIKNATSQLNQVDSSLGELKKLLDQAKTIASANVGSDVTPEARQNAATVLDSIYKQAVAIANQQANGIYLFAGDRSTAPPFVEEGGGVKFVGSRHVLSNTFDDGVSREFQVNGADVFGAYSTRIQGATNLAPTLSSNTRLSDLAGATGDGVRPGIVRLSDGTTTTDIDLAGADTVGDVVKRINAAAVGGITASVGPNGLQLNASGADNISLIDVGGGTASLDLGINQPTPAGVGANVVGTSVGAKVTSLSPLSALFGGTGLDPAGFTITNGQTSKTINFTGVNTVEDLLNKINNAGVNVTAELNSAGTGLNLLNATQGLNLTINENGGNTATQLGLRSFNPTTPLAELNAGKGVRTVTGSDFKIIRSDGTSFDVDVDGATTTQDVIDKINTASGGSGVTASFAATGNGLVLTDSAGGAGTVAVQALNFSSAAADLGLDRPASGNVIAGKDVNPVQSTGLFATLQKLRSAMFNSDTRSITDAAGQLEKDITRVIKSRGDVGSRVKEFTDRADRLDDQNVATKSLLSEVQDVDYTSAITRYQQLQTTLQATLQMTGATANISLLDYLR